MSLDNFKNRAIVWDTVNKDFPQPIQIMQGDVNARTLSVKIIDNGGEIDLTGHSLKLTYQYTNSSNSGFVMVPPENLTKGEFILVIPTEMTATGVIEANLILLSEDKEQVIVSKKLTFISDNSTVTDLAQEVNNKIDDFTKLLLENIPQVMRSELNDLHAQTDSTTSKIELKANVADMTSLQNAITKLQNEVETFGITPENSVTIKSLLDKKTGILSDLSQKGIDITNLRSKIDEVRLETTAQLAYKVPKGVASKNLFNKDTVKANTVINSSTGQEVSEEGGFTSDFIPVDASTPYYKNIWFAAFFYTADKTFISMSKNGVFAITTPANAVYMRVVFTPSVRYVTPENGQVERGTVGTSYEPFGAKLKTSQLLDPDTLTKGLTNGLPKVYPWRNATIVNDKTVNLGFRPTFQSVATGKRIFFNMDTTPNLTLSDAQQLILEWDGKTDLNLTDLTRIKVIAITQALTDNQHVLFSNIAGVVSSPINIYQQNIYKYQNPTAVLNTLKPLSVNTSLKKEAPTFFKKHRLKEKDVTVVLNGESIATTNRYTTPRTDAKNRPPLMTEHAFVTIIEEQLRWDGQKYYRYDTDIFTETADNKDTLEYDLHNWDWASNNNRPALTRVLSGSDVSVSYVVPTEVKRCDFIYRTDALNAESAEVAVSGGNGIISVFDEEQNEWVEANGYIYSAKESADPISTPFGPLMKSMYQKRLKMKVVGALNNTTVTISNNGNGRLTYWGIQTSVREAMFDFILSARGGHSIGRLEQFEEWDTDYYKPDLILWQIPIINQSLDVGNTDFKGRNVGTRTTAVYANTILAKANQYKAKPYGPELVSWIMFFGRGNNAIDTNNEWVYGYTDSGERVSVPSYLSKTVGTLEANDISVIDMFSLFMDYSKKKAAQENKNIIDAVLNRSGITGNTLTIDGTHFNDFGSDISTQIFGPFFIQ